MVHILYSEDNIQNDPVEHCLKWILFLGRALGVVPLSFEFKPRINLQLRWCSFSALHTIFLAIIALGICIIQLDQSIQNTGSLTDILEEIRQFGFRVTVVFLYFHFLRNARNILELLSHWSQATKSLNLLNTDRGFPKFCVLITILVLGIGIAENLMCNVCTSENFDGGTPLEKLLNNKTFFDVISANMNTVLSVLLLYTMKMATYSWNFGDLFLIVVCRAVSQKWKLINDEIGKYITETEITRSIATLACSPPIRNAKTKKDGLVIITVDDNLNLASKNGCSKLLVDEGDDDSKNKIIQHHKTNILQLQISPQSQHVTKASSHQSSQTSVFSSWSEIRENVLILCKLSQDCTNLVAPLVLACYGCNLYLIIQRLFRVLYKLTTDSSHLLSAMQFTMRVILVTYHASQVYHSTEKVVDTLERCSDATFSDTACRLERLLDRHPVGVNIFGAFRITRKIFISIVSFLFTTEILLLQSMSAVQGKPESDQSVN